MLAERPRHVERRLTPLGHVLGVRRPVRLEGRARHGAGRRAVHTPNSDNGVPRACVEITFRTPNAIDATSSPLPNSLVDFHTASDPRARTGGV